MMEWYEAATLAALMTSICIVIYWVGWDAGVSHAIGKHGDVVEDAVDPCRCGRLNHVGEFPRVFDGMEHTRETCLPVAMKIRRRV